MNKQLNMMLRKNAIALNESILFNGAKESTPLVMIAAAKIPALVALAPATVVGSAIILGSHCIFRVIAGRWTHGEDDISKIFKSALIQGNTAGALEKIPYLYFNSKYLTVSQMPFKQNNKEVIAAILPRLKRSGALKPLFLWCCAEGGSQKMDSAILKMFEPYLGLQKQKQGMLSRHFLSGALAQAAGHGNTQAVEYLLPFLGKKLPPTALVEAALGGHKDAFDLLLEGTDQVKALAIITKKLTKGEVQLHAETEASLVGQLTNLTKAKESKDELTRTLSQITPKSASAKKRAM